MANKLCTTMATVAILGLSLDVYAATCNPKAQTHQARAQNILLNMQFKNDYIPSQADEEFVLCMIEEKEDKEDFQRHVQEHKAEKRNAEARQEQERVKAAEQQQRDQQLANQHAQEEAAREAQAEHRVVSIQGAGGRDGYYIGRVTPDYVIIIEPLMGLYTSVGLIVDSYPPRPSLSAVPGKRIPVGQMGGTGVQYKTSGPIRIKVRDAFSQDRIGYAQINFMSADTMQIRVTILCVNGVNSITCNDHDVQQLPSHGIYAPSPAHHVDSTRSLRDSCASGDIRNACIWIAETISSTCKKLQQCSDLMVSTLRANNLTFTTNDNYDPFDQSMPDFQPGCIGYRSDIGGTKEGAVALVKLLGETQYFVDDSKCHVSGFKYNVIRR